MRLKSRVSHTFPCMKIETAEFKARRVGGTKQLHRSPQSAEVMWRKIRLPKLQKSLDWHALISTSTLKW